ncbi:zinc finger FYVE domain-containing protein 16 isoform X1 [Anser cygnoides]|uniref:zinc finger FYVE domain-containing protein 16 isoform X1 n=1 Tax=Anser cygnoides TaxID=8845 RepID=UPI0020096054|nr:zinc finger FYVE domain-containing protein 16 isoform X2 [Anser cygnoides]
MDSYFKAAVCDLDKLLDEFEQNTDECDFYRTPQNPYDSKQHSFSSDLDGLQHAYPTPKLHEDACMASEEISRVSHTGPNEGILNYPSQNEKSVAGPDLLSTVDSSSSKEIQASTPGRCSIPVCDLVNDTGNVIHSAGSSEDNQKLQPHDSQPSEDCLIGFGIPCIPIPVCVSSVSCSGGVSSTEQCDGDSMLQDSGHLKTEESSPLPLKSDVFAKTTISEPCGDTQRTESLKCSEVFDQPEQTACLNTACVSVTSQSSNVYSPKDETAYGKLSCEPEDESACSAVSKEMYGGNALEDEGSKDQSKDESMPSDLPKRPQLHKTHATLPGSCVLPGSTCQTGTKLALEEKITEENVNSEELAGSEILSSVSPSCVSVKDVQTSLSVSERGSSVVTEEVNPLPQNEMVEVISDSLTIHAGKSTTDVFTCESWKETDLHEQEEYLPKINQTVVEKSAGGERCDTENAIDDSDSEQIKAIVSAFQEYEAEPYGVGTDSYYNESIGQVVADFSLEEGIIKSDTLISDAELDEFLYGQSHQSNLTLDNDSNLMEADAEQMHLTNENLDFTEVAEEHTQTKLEDITSINSNLEVSLTANKLESPTEGVHIQDVTENGSEALVSKFHSEGARPKQLFGLPQGAAGQRQLNETEVPERENQEVNSVTPEVPLSSTSIKFDKNSEPAGESSTETGGSQTSESAEPVKTPAALSQKQPLWVPDSEAPNCMNCQVKFTFTKRRHHCRACGKVFCGACCKRKCKLQYMEKEARVCTGCYDDINKAQAFERMMSPTGLLPNSSVSSECSAAPLQEAQIPGSANTPSSSALSPISVLKQPGIEVLFSQPILGLFPKEQRRVWFADGILPTGEVADTTKLSSGAKRSSQDLSPVNPDLPEMHMAANPEEDDILTDVNSKPKEEIDVITRMEGLCPSVPSEQDVQQPVCGQSEMAHIYRSVTPGSKESSATEDEKTSSSLVDRTKSDMPVSPSSYRALCGVENCVSREISLVPDGDKLPPLLLAVGGKGKDPLVEEHPSHQQVTLLLAEGGPNPLTFILNANLLVNVKLISYSSEKCWYFSTNGLHGLGQAEIIILLQCLPDEETFPNEILKLFINIYKDAVKGRFIRNMENITFTENFLNNKDHGGFLFVSPTFQKLDDLILPDNPFLCGILIHKMEIPWAKVFPIRLMLRLGAEYGAYPTPLVSFRHRKPLFGEIGHTVMNLLVDLRNYQYTLHTIDNLFVHVEMGRSCIKIPLRKYNEVMKVVNSSNDHVISIGASFNTEADSHLVCVQNKHGHYHTQANSATEHPRKVTGASFVVFNGALKTSSGFLAKSSIVEDGLMVQITPETMESLRQALRNKEDFNITCGKVDAEGLKEYVDICWVENEEKTNKGILSPVDGKSMEGTQSEKVPHSRDFEREGKVLKCTEVYYFLKDHELTSPVPLQFAKEIAIACSTALCPHLKTLKNNGMNKIGLRVSVDSDMVEYLAGSGGRLLPQYYLNELDSALIPVIHGGMSDPTSLPLKMELVFFLIEHLF